MAIGKKWDVFFWGVGMCFGCLGCCFCGMILGGWDVFLGVWDVFGCLGCVLGVWDVVFVG